VRVTLKALVSLPLVLALVLPSLPARAQDEADPNAVRMSLAECLTRALENNLALRILKLDPDVARHSVTFQDAVFDPQRTPKRLPSLLFRVNDLHDCG